MIDLISSLMKMVRFAQFINKKWSCLYDRMDFIYLLNILVYQMKKVSSSASYSQFRKKNPNIKDNAPKQTGISEIDELSKQLQALNSRKKMNSFKYDHPNGIIEEQQQDQIYCPGSASKNKATTSAAKKLKAITTKVQFHQVKAQPHKLNKTSEAHTVVKKQKQKVVNKQTSMKMISTKVNKPQQQKPKAMTRRMSLTNLTKVSSLSTNESINTTTSQSEIPMTANKKKQILDKIASIQQKIAKKCIPSHLFEDIMVNLDKLDCLLEDS